MDGKGRDQALQELRTVRDIPKDLADEISAAFSLFHSSFSETVRIRSAMQGGVGSKYRAVAREWGGPESDIFWAGCA